MAGAPVPLGHLGATIHDLRHTYASWLAQDGVPLGRIAELLGHASTSTTEIYAHFSRPYGVDDTALALTDPRGANGGRPRLRPTSWHYVALCEVPVPDRVFTASYYGSLSGAI